MRALACILLLAACKPAPPAPPPPPDLAATPDLAPLSYLVGRRVCIEPLGYSWMAIAPDLTFVYQGLAGKEPRRWCYKDGQFTVIMEQGDRVLATLHHYHPLGESDYEVDINGTAWLFTVAGAPHPNLDPNTCTRCPSLECDAHDPAPLGIAVCDPTVHDTPDGFTPADLLGVPMNGDAWERPLDGTPPDGEH